MRWPPLVLVFLTGRPRIRNVMPLVLALVVLAEPRAHLFDDWLKGSVDDVQARERVAALGGSATSGRRSGPALLFSLRSEPAGGVLGWWAIRRMALTLRGKEGSATCN
jgi:hypothetical protein